MIPILLVLLCGIVEFGRIFSAGLTVSSVAREGARIGAVGGTDSQIVSRIEDAAAGLNPALLEVTIAPLESNRMKGQQISVSVEYPVAIVAPFVSVFTGDTVTVGSTSIMRME